MAYNFYHPDVNPKLIPQFQQKNILGWVDETGVARNLGIPGGVPKGQAIYRGIENNPHLTAQDHKDAVFALNDRKKRIQEFLNTKKTSPEESNQLQQEISDLTEQQTHHKSKASLQKSLGVISAFKTRNQK
jgi:hypothetical protein